MKSVVQKFKKLIFSDRCSSCSNTLSYEESYICNRCKRYLKADGFLKNSGDYYYLYYYDNNIKKIIADYKLKNRRSIGEFLGEIVGDKIKTLIAEKNIDYVIPVPISKERVAERGFNQVEEILEKGEIKFFKIQRVKDSKHMYSLKNEVERRENVKDIFEISGELTGKTLLIVDDILTTGATVFELMKEIRKNYKVEKIYVFSIAIAQKFLKKG